MSLSGLMAKAVSLLYVVVLFDGLSIIYSLRGDLLDDGGPEVLSWVDTFLDVLSCEVVSDVDDLGPELVVTGDDHGDLWLFIGHVEDDTHGVDLVG